MDKSDYFKLREAYVTGSSNLVKAQIPPLIEHLKKSNCLDNLLRHHPLGFMYGRLFEFQNGDCLRIHVWSNSSKTQQPLMNIHNHYYTVNSYVLSGEVNNSKFEVYQEDEPTHAVFKGTYGKNDERVLTRTPIKYCLKLIEQEIIEAGELYIIEKDEIHSGGAETDFAVYNCPNK